MKSIGSFAEFNWHLREFIHRCEHDEERFTQLASALFALQFDSVQPYRRLCQARGAAPEKIAHWTEIPCVPAAAFKEFDLSSLPAAERSTVFRSSGTTGRHRSRHFHNAESLAIYEASLLPWFNQHMLPDAGQFLFLSLTPPPGVALSSSLAHMLGTVHREFGSPDSCFIGTLDPSGNWALDLAGALGALRSAIDADRPVAILGTAFGFVHLLSYLSLRQVLLHLPAGSRAMETGGYKGRSQELPKSELHALITRGLGIPASHIVAEYGMSELSSQAYDRAATLQPFNPSTFQPSTDPTVQRIFAFPPWARSRVVSPETSQEVREGESGLIQVYDLANVRSVMAIQTEDLAVRRENGFEMLGRAASAEPRGCSLMSVGAASGTV